MKEGSLSDRAYGQIKEMIRDRSLPGGAVIGEVRLSEALNISRTPLREALQRLEGEGLMLKTAGRSFIVRKVELPEYLSSLNVRILLECEATRLAFGRIPDARIARVRQELNALSETPVFDRLAHWRLDERVHGLICDHCGNPVLAKMIGALRVATNLFEVDRVADRVEPDSTEHLDLLDALEQGPVEAAVAAMHAHLESVRQSAAGDLTSERAEIAL